MANITVIPTNGTETISLEDLAAEVCQLKNIVGELAPPVKITYSTFNGYFEVQISKYTGTFNTVTFSVDGIGSMQQTNVLDGTQITLVLPNTVYPMLGETYNMTVTIDDNQNSSASTIFTTVKGTYINNLTLVNGQITGSVVTISGGTVDVPNICNVYLDYTTTQPPTYIGTAIDGVPFNFSIQAPAVGSGKHSVEAQVVNNSSISSSGFPIIGAFLPLTL